MRNGEIMGLIYAPVTIRNPADSSKYWEGTFLVDTGAIDSLVPRDVLDTIGVAPKGQREYTLADGSKVDLDAAPAAMEIMGTLIGTMVVFGEAGSKPLLGRISLNAAGIKVDPHNQTLTKLPSMRMVGFRRR